jgi:hypothetical protein
MKHNIQTKRIGNKKGNTPLSLEARRSIEAIILIPSRSVCSSETPDFVFLLLLTYDQNVLLFDFAVSAICFSRFFPGPDQVHPKVLYELTNIIDKPLCTIFNSSFKTGTVPEGWRIGQITALFKKGSKNSASNYRPVKKISQYLSLFPIV